MSLPLRIGTRGSQLALWQAHEVARRIEEHGGPACRIVVIKTSGDRLQEAPLSEIGGKRLFVKEIEDALLGQEIDLAVHSAKDLPAELPGGLVIAGVLPREDPRDAVVLPPGRDGAPPVIPDTETLRQMLGNSPSIGTGSVRRVAQLMRVLPGAHFAPIRGNLDTRLRKLDEGGHAAIVLAAAGLRRLGFGSRISLALSPAACLPAPGQGIVAIETRVDDGASRGIAGGISDPAAATALLAERALVEALGGGCQIPLGGLATVHGDQVELAGLVVALDGSRIVRASDRGRASEAESVGQRVGARLIAEGAGQILSEARTRLADR